MTIPKESRANVVSEPPERSGPRGPASDGVGSPRGEAPRKKMPCTVNVMEQRRLGRTDMTVSTIGFGAWAIGGSWGEVDDEASMRALHAGIDAGMNFIDTADVYGDGRSERLVARLRRRERPGETIRVLTKAGRRLPQQTCEGYSRENLVAWIERSLTNLEMDALDLLQLHCPPSQLYRQPEVFGILDDLVTAGKLRYYGVSVETVDEALTPCCILVQSIQIIFNMFRLKPAESSRRGRETSGRHPGPRAAGERPAGPESSAGHRLRRRRSPIVHREGQAFDKETLSGVP